MTRFSVLAVAAAGALLGVTSAYKHPFDAHPNQCNPKVCMELAIARSDCTDGLNPGPVVPFDAAPSATSASNCVCADEALREVYTSCYGFCRITPQNDPYCGVSLNEPVSHGHEKRKAVGDENVVTNELIESEFDKKKAKKPKKPCPPCRGPNCDKWAEYCEMSGLVGFCGVPGQACGTKTTDITDDAEIAKLEHPEITPTAELVEQMEIAERAPTKVSGTLRNWIGFCGVPGQACGEKVATTLATKTVKDSALEITAPAELVEHVDIAERVPTKVRGTLRNWIGFCGVPGQACGMKVATATMQDPVETVQPIVEDSLSEAGSNVVDIGSVRSSSLKDKIGKGDKRDVAVKNKAPKILQ